ncbi:PIG-L deacetylase family protein [Chlorogloea sp. CCALA 695]|uniref:PIG-L deacetylase family protein n=1 Tax=Chlorogloea sp. CCALA 695 TaxID=2107693 RepID=UPI000D04F202|nr:PIG-L family deacetylase [Chlorogloea sp. CCALA 695]PSB31420.1 PIG-L domain-containing protein [Chlorogloea sp. CCALA 695]
MVARLLLTSPELPLIAVAEIAVAKALIVAPHPDDETLGCGGAIALLRSIGCDVRVLVISDGTLSHPNSRKYPRLALQELRESETISALAILGVEATAIKFLRLQDGSVSSQNADISSYLAQITPEIVFLPLRYDPHPDHRASFQLVSKALTSLNMTPRLLEYPIWDWDDSQSTNWDNNKLTSWQLDISSVVELKQQAIASYRSQITNLIDDDPQGFRLTPEMLANFNRPVEVYLEEYDERIAT